MAAGKSNANMETDYGANQASTITDSGWDLEASYLNVLSSKQVLLDLTRVQDVKQIADKDDASNPLIMKPKDGDNKNEIDLYFTYAIYSGGELDSYPTDTVKGDITTTTVSYTHLTLPTNSRV